MSLMERFANKADQTYQRNVKNVEKLMGDLQKLIKQHQERQKQFPTDYGYAGDMGHIEDICKQAVSFLSGGADRRTKSYK